MSDSANEYLAIIHLVKAIEKLSKTDVIKLAHMNLDFSLDKQTFANKVLSFSEEASLPGEAAALERFFFIKVFDLYDAIAEAVGAGTSETVDALHTDLARIRSNTNYNILGNNDLPPAEYDENGNEVFY